MHRNWIGIDITHLAISLIEKRLKDAFNLSCEVEGTPKDFSGAKDLAFRDKYQFQWWACSLVNAIPYKNKKKGADGGIDGLIFFNDSHGKKQKIIVFGVKDTFCGQIVNSRQFKSKFEINFESKFIYR